MQINRYSLLLIFFIPLYAFSQIPQKEFVRESFSDKDIEVLRTAFGMNKEYPKEFELPILIALAYYPELKNTHIRFRIRDKHTPLATRSKWSGLLSSRVNRPYVITISDKTEDMLMPLLFKHQPFNAQVGVIGHELGHVVDFSRMRGSRIIWHGIRSISWKYVDKFEYRTDSICIAHGLAYQLLTWSMYVRKTMHKDNWDGADNVHKPMMRERYMNPSTITTRIAADKQYQ